MSPSLTKLMRQMRAPVIEGAASFDPALYMDMWHDPRYGNTPDGSNRVASYTDTITGGARTYVQATDLKKPILTAGVFGGGTLPSLRFTAASSQFMQLGSSVACPSFTAIIVVRYRSVARMALLGRASEGYIFCAGNNVISNEIWDGGVNFADFTETYSTSTSYLYTIEGKTSPATSVVTRYNSLGVPTVFSSAGLGGTSWASMSHFYLGTRSGTSFFADADMGPTGLALSALTAPEIAYMVDGVINEEGWLA